MEKIKIFQTCVASIVMVLSFSIAAAAYPYTIPFPGDFADTTEKTEVPCGEAMRGKTMVAFVLGQSNSANHGESRMASKRNVYNFYDGECYLAADPMLQPARRQRAGSQRPSRRRTPSHRHRRRAPEGGECR